MLLKNKATSQGANFAMGTVMMHKVFGARAGAGLEAVCGEIDRLEGLLSRFLPDSEISRVNEYAGVQSVKVSLETFEVLSKAVEFSRNFPGCFDITIAPVVRLWSTAKESLAEPEQASIDQALCLVDYRDLILDPWEMTAGLKNSGQSIDLGGIGKGYAGDKILEIYREFGISSAYSNLGGNVVTRGTKPDGSPWMVGVQHPREEGRIIGAISVVDQSVVTSGDYQRYYTDRQGKRRHHIIDPGTGYPSDSGVVSVSIVSDRSVVADALSTILFIAGKEKGLEFLKKYPRTEAVLVDADLQVYVTSGLKYRFQADQDVDVTFLD